MVFSVNIIAVTFQVQQRMYYSILKISETIIKELLE